MKDAISRLEDPAFPQSGTITKGTAKMLYAQSGIMEIEKCCPLPMNVATVTAKVVADERRHEFAL